MMLSHSAARTPVRGHVKPLRRQVARQSRTICAAYSIFSPSKVNLFLRIIRRREDGYHDLASLFHVIDLGDTLTFDIIDGAEDRLACNVVDVPTDASNLVIKALNLFRKHTGASRPSRIQLMQDSTCTLG